jgi:prophage regulatory protein
MNTKMTLTRRTLRIRRVTEKTGFSASSVWRLAQSGQFPQPVQLSPGCTAWFEHEIDEWLEAKGLKRDAEGRNPERESPL